MASAAVCDCGTPWTFLLPIYDCVGSLYANRFFFFFFCISVLRVASGPRVKLASCKSALNPALVYSTAVLRKKKVREKSREWHNHKPQPRQWSRC